VRAAILVVALCGVLAACTTGRPWGEVTDRDRQRFEILRADPVFGGLGVPTHGGPGEYRDALLTRGTVSVDLVGLTGPEALRERGLEMLDAAGRTGWTIYRTECTGAFGVPGTGPPLLWNAGAYKIVDGVSYVLRIASAAASPGYPVTGDGAILVDAYAPHSDEPADLILEHPRAVSAPCIRWSVPPADTTVQGFDVVFDSGFNRDTGPRGGGVR
jgi:hypothetical protein